MHLETAMGQCVSLPYRTFLAPCGTLYAHLTHFFVQTSHFLHHAAYFQHNAADFRHHIDFNVGSVQITRTPTGVSHPLRQDYLQCQCLPRRQGVFPPCPVATCPVAPCPVAPCPAAPCPAVPCPAVPCPAAPYQAIPPVQHLGKELEQAVVICEVRVFFSKVTVDPTMTCHYVGFIFS